MQPTAKPCPSDEPGGRSATAPEVVTLEVRHGSMKNFNYLIVDPATRQAAIIDPAWEMAKIDAALQAEGAALAAVLVTHSHPDHIHLAVPLAEKYGCPIWMSEEEIAACGLAAPRLMAIDGTPRLIGRMPVRPVLTPGHTRGSICYLAGDNLFTGDTLFAEGCGWCTDTSAAYAMFDSLEYLKRILAPHTRVYPGHSYGLPPGQPFSRLLRENIYLQFSGKEAFAAFRLRRGQDRQRMFRFV